MSGQSLAETLREGNLRLTRELVEERDALRAENTRLREALSAPYGIIWRLQAARYKGHGRDALRIALAAINGCVSPLQHGNAGHVCGGGSRAAGPLMEAHDD